MYKARLDSHVEYVSGFRLGRGQVAEDGLGAQDRLGNFIDSGYDVYQGIDLGHGSIGNHWGHQAQIESGLAAIHGDLKHVILFRPD